MRLLAALFFSACLACLTAFSPSQVQAQTLSAASDSMAKRMQACTTCHGAGVTASVGRTANETYFPRIAGKPAGYLYNQLRNFRDGRRHYGLMVGMVEHLSDAYLLEMAQYFANLDLPYPPPPAVKTGTSADTMARGRSLVMRGDAARGIPACVACHGAALMGVAPAIPALLGLPRDYVAGQLGSWKTGLRRAQSPDCMAHVVQSLQAPDIDALTTWLAAQPVPTLSKPAGSLPAPLPLPCGGLP